MEILHLKELSDTESVITKHPLGVYLVIDKFVHIAFDICVNF